MAESFEFRTTPRIVMGPGSATGLPRLMQDAFGARHVLLVTDAGLVRAGLIAPVLTAFETAGIAVTLYDGVQADPPEAIIAEALERAAGCDAVLGLGGGSSLDVAKLVAVLQDGRQSLPEIYGVGNVIGDRRTPLVLVPTTAGTGSEVTPISIVTTGKAVKTGVVSPQLYPDIAVLDAALTAGLPAHVTAATGIDAMVHAIEAYTSRLRKNPISDGLARRALELLSANLLKVLDDGSNLAARGEMLLGSMLAGQAFANAPVAAVHALAYPVGGIFHVPHGLSNALVLVPVLRFNLPQAVSDYAELAAILAPDVTGPATRRAEAFVDAMDRLARDAGLERQLREVGIAEADIDRLADDAMGQTRLLVNNPREVTRADAAAIYRAAY